ncbi:DUF4013 domain-containing protein [Candidatus Woesearchaeota archaeon]|nr:DUF4013 domain-containing protein [Candidatus Woesearchaeota archaeon]
MDIQKAFKRPFLDAQKFIIGALLNILPIINFFSFGYVLKAAKMTLNKQDGLPEWDNWGDLFLQGLLSIAILIVYTIPVAIIAGIIAISSGLSLLTVQSFDMNMFAALGTTAIVAVVLLLILWYVIPSAILAYVQENRFGAAFEFKNVFSKAFNSNYFVAWIVGVAISLVLGGVANLIPVVGFVFVAAANFASAMIMFTLIGETYNA